MTTSVVALRLQAIVAPIDGILEATLGQAFDHIRGNFLHERVVELISDESGPIPAALPTWFPAEAFAPVLTLAEKLQDNDYRIETFKI